MLYFSSVTVIPLLLLLCQCGAAGMAGAFTDMPYDTKEHLISYHTEGQGEDRVIHLASYWFTLCIWYQKPHLIEILLNFWHKAKEIKPFCLWQDVPALGPVDNIDAGMIGLISKEVGGMRLVSGGGAAGGYMDSTSTMGGRGYNEMEMAYMDSLMRNDNFMSREVNGDFDGMAVSEMFLGEYYSQVIYSYRIM